MIPRFCEALESRHLLAAATVSLLLGPSVDLYAQAATLDPGGNMFLVGSTSTSIDIDPRPAVENRVASSGAWSDFIVKYAPDGTPLWVLKIARPDLPASFDIASMASDSAGNIFLAGTLAGSFDFNLGKGNFTLTSTPTPDGDARQSSDAFVWKIKPDGSFGWAALAGVLPTGEEIGTAIAFDRFGSVYLAGRSTPEAPHTSSPSGSTRTLLAKFSSTGQFAWKVSAKLGPAGAVAVDPTDCPVMATSGANLRLVKFNGRGRYVSYLSTAARVSQTGSLTVSALDFDAAGNAVLAGGFAGTFDFAPGKQVLLMGPRDSDGQAPNAFVQKVAANGSLAFAFQLGDSGPDTCIGARINRATGDIYIGGHFSGSADFNPSRFGSAILNTSDDTDLFAARYTATGRYLGARSAVTDLGDLAVGFGYASPGYVFITGGLHNPGPDVRSIHLYREVLS